MTGEWHSVAIPTARFWRSIATNRIHALSHWPHSNRRSERALLLRARSLCNRFEITSEQSTLNLTQDFLQSVELFSEKVCSVHAHFVFGSELYIYIDLAYILTSIQRTPNLAKPSSVCKYNVLFTFSQIILCIH